MSIGEVLGVLLAFLVRSRYHFITLGGSFASD